MPGNFGVNSLTHLPSSMAWTLIHHVQRSRAMRIWNRWFWIPTSKRCPLNGAKMLVDLGRRLDVECCCYRFLIYVFGIILHFLMFLLYIFWYLKILWYKKPSSACDWRRMSLLRWETFVLTSSWMMGAIPTPAFGIPGKPCSLVDGSTFFWEVGAGFPGAGDVLLEALAAAPKKKESRAHNWR